MSDDMCAQRLLQLPGPLPPCWALIRDAASAAGRCPFVSFSYAAYTLAWRAETSRCGAQGWQAGCNPDQRRAQPAAPRLLRVPSHQPGSHLPAGSTSWASFSAHGPSCRAATSLSPVRRVDTVVRYQLQSPSQTILRSVEGRASPARLAIADLLAACPSSPPLPAGESYAGHYVPAVASRVFHASRSGEVVPPINLQVKRACCVGPRLKGLDRRCRALLPAWACWPRQR